LDIESEWSLLSYSDSLSSSIRTAADPTIGNGQFDPAKSFATAAWIDLGAIAKMATPWIRYGIDRSQGIIVESQTISLFGTDLTIDLSSEEIVNAWRATERLGGMSSVTSMNKDGSSYSRSIFVFSD
jgi:hypothetical protein